LLGKGRSRRRPQSCTLGSPAISKHIAELEKALRLIDRAGRDGVLTSASDFLASYALRAKALLVHAGLDADQLRESDTGLVAVVASSLTDAYSLPDIISELQHSHPGVRVTLQVGTALQAIEMLRSYRAELGFLVGGGRGDVYFI
jgi:DNA-binding transcriptional LysR family regulator